jgi:release factor glutamine methyltransferase
MALGAGAGTAREALDAAVDALEAAGVEEARLDAELMLAEATGLDRARFAAEPEAEVTARAGRAFGEMVRRRLCREPVAYILRRRGFRRIEVAVDSRVLIPRPETELLVELALELRPGSVLDVGTGSGAVALAIADELPECSVTATDTSPVALQVALENARRLGLEERVDFVEGTLPPRREFDLLVANLPYVSERDWPKLQPEVVHWEPREALLAGRDGLDEIRALLATALPARQLALEVGAGQAEHVARMLDVAGFEEVRTRRDLAGIERLVWALRG